MTAHLTKNNEVGQARSYMIFILWNLLLCNQSRFIIIDTLKLRKAFEVAKSIFQKLICAHGTNMKEIYCDLDTGFKNDIISTLFNSSGIQ